jgi:E3 ubiquitin-protein ligase TRIP12
LDAFAARKIRNLNANQTPFATLVKKLQESLTRMETFDVITVAANSDGWLQLVYITLMLIKFSDSKRSSPSLLARQLRLRLVAGDDSDIPKSLQNIVVSIHAIATFQALHDYLRPRVSGLLSSGSRLSGMFAALGYVGSGLKSGDEASTKPPKLTESTTAASASVQLTSRRRSQRLAKQIPGALARSITPPNNDIISSVADGISSGAEPASSEIVAEPEFEADFSDDENFDAEVFDDDLDRDNSISEKTITLSVAEGL